jgi:site-specific DNA-methyltransferase (adenine-specific)
MRIELNNKDCLEAMKQMTDNQFDLAIVDPPYGIDVANDSRFGGKGKKAAAKTKDYSKKDWDKGVPTQEYFEQLFRVSKNQIIWGINYYPFDFLTGGRLFWDKDVPQDYTKSKGEIAYKSFGHGVDLVKITWHGMLQYDMKNKEHRIHPTQKPVRLYEWILDKYATKGQTILDTHLGSGSIALACHNRGYSLTAFEIDKEYFEAAKKRLEIHQAQLTMF